MLTMNLPQPSTKVVDSFTAPCQWKTLESNRAQRTLGPPGWLGSCKISPSKSAKSDKDSAVLEET